ncbi:hypothetical protein ABU162_09205 [Paenibacillus thiaminolyticus]|uniref:hypothetical protein n=1 Tax=Paenibacillus thiaminolyticus TaxID=49283 RepID=UPI0035A67B8E
MSCSSSSLKMGCLQKSLLQEGCLQKSSLQKGLLQAAAGGWIQADWLQAAGGTRRIFRRGHEHCASGTAA